MRVCPYCAIDNQEGMLFCFNCGQELYSPQYDKTLRRRPPKQSPGSFVPSHDAPAPTLTVLLLYVSGASEPIMLELGQQVVIGRVSPNTLQKPDVDLTAWAGLENGVSRIHAAIERSADGPLLTDLDSVNGTYLNGQQLIAHESYPLHEGDEVCLGTLTIHIYFK
jgi:hypothetical protein